MNVDVSTDVVINRQPANVSAYASNPDHVPARYKNIKSVEWKTDRSRLVHGSRSSPGSWPTIGIYVETAYTWQPVANDRTRMTLRNRGTPTGFTAWVAPFMAYAMRRANRKDLALLKRLLETSGVRT